jgi:hypothetical protein
MLTGLVAVNAAFEAAPAVQDDELAQSGKLVAIRWLVIADEKFGRSVV